MGLKINRYNLHLLLIIDNKDLTKLNHFRPASKTNNTLANNIPGLMFFPIKNQKNKCQAMSPWLLTRVELFRKTFIATTKAQCQDKPLGFAACLHETLETWENTYFFQAKFRKKALNPSQVSRRGLGLALWLESNQRTQYTNDV